MQKTTWYVLKTQHLIATFGFWSGPGTFRSGSRSPMLLSQPGPGADAAALPQPRSALASAGVWALSSRRSLCFPSPSSIPPLPPSLLFLGFHLLVFLSSLIDFIQNISRLIVRNSIQQHKTHSLSFWNLECTWEKRSLYVKWVGREPARWPPGEGMGRPGERRAAALHGRCNFLGSLKKDSTYVDSKDCDILCFSGYF